MIGNDIVDLKLASRQSNWRRKGFLEKVFTSSERKIIKASEVEEVCVWLLWSMKEAAYKAHQRKWSLPRRLNWTVQECISLIYLGNQATGIVKIEEEIYFSFSNLDESIIHTIVTNENASLHQIGLFQLPLVQTKLLFKNQISSLLDIPVARCQLRKTEAEIPVLCVDNHPFALPFSFSDHGRFSGFCVSLRMS